VDKIEPKFPADASVVPIVSLIPEATAPVTKDVISGAKKLEPEAKPRPPGPVIPEPRAEFKAMLMGEPDVFPTTVCPIPPKNDWPEPWNTCVVLVLIVSVTVCVVNEGGTPIMFKGPP
jgi:hypothetical protein